MFLLTRVANDLDVRGRGGRALAAALLLAGVLVTVSGLPAHAERTVTITGGGFGHGIGMSQYGAYGRALKGRTSTQILQHYYTGARVTKKDMPAALRVGLLPAYGSSLNSATFTSHGGPSNGKIVLTVAGSNQRLALGDANDVWRIEAGGGGGVNIFKNGHPFKKDGRTSFGDGSHPLVVRYARFKSTLHLTEKNNDYRYGEMEFGNYACSSGRCLRVVLSVPMQLYIYGLGEVPSSWPLAALEAQAVAGRTYAYSKVTRTGQHRAPCDCAVYDSTIDQAYIGDAKRTGSGTYWKRWKRAVDDTDREVLMADHEPIEALYSSSSGGHTENNENVWGGAPISYLRGVDDSPDYAGGANPNYRWTITMPYSTFESRLNAAYGIGTLKAFQLLKPFGVSGRVTVVKGDKTGGIRIVGSSKVVRVSGWTFRGTFGLKDTLFRVDLGHEIGDRFKRRWNRLKGAPGDPTSDVYGVPRKAPRRLGSAQNFEVGRMVYNRGNDAVTWQFGHILDEYDASGREAGPLGMPRSSIWGPGAYLGARYAGGRILWSHDFGAHKLLGPFNDAYTRAGGAKGKLGLPTGDQEPRKTLPSGGKRQAFVGGKMYLNPHKDEAFFVWGPLAKRYVKIGEASSPCGYPVADIASTASGVRLALQHGSITSNAGNVKVSCS
jgi:SpoIID/LytB domain protein